MQKQATQFGPVQIGIILLTLVTALVHLVILNLRSIDLLFTLNGIGYLVLLIALFLPQLSGYRNLIRWVLILFTAVTIIAWVAVGAKNILGYVDKLLEVILIVFLFVDRGR